MIFAHHVEPKDFPILSVFALVGFWLGWHVVGLLLDRRKPKPIRTGG